MSWTQSTSLQWPHAQMYWRSCLTATATHFPFIPTRIAHHSPAKGKVAVAADIINCKEFTELSLPVKWAQPFPFPNHELSGQNFSGKRGKNEWIGQGVRPGIDGCWDSLGRTNLLQLSQWDRAKGTEQCSSSKGRQRWYRAVLIRGRCRWAPHFHVVTMDLGWTLPDGGHVFQWKSKGTYR